ncbi:MAG: WecB/TagA/CpsF family glycosyltransferase [bacterium]|nr:WecB/TagA/CpsF family glycosyltransferase [bacterium]
MGKIEILGVQIDDFSEAEVMSLIQAQISHGKKFWVTTPNPEFLVEAQNSEGFRKLLNESDLAVPDGIGLVLASNFLGTKPRIKKRITGADLVGQILAATTSNNWSIGLAGARAGDSKERAELIANLKIRFPGLKIENTEEIRDWQEKEYDFIFACQGMGKQERWIRQNKGESQAKVFIGIGGALDFYGGMAKRAPKFLRNIGLEWAWRLTQRPKSHSRRVYRAFIQFGLLVLKEKYASLGRKDIV